jgi:hypothetical protein
MLAVFECDVSCAVAILHMVDDSAPQLLLLECKHCFSRLSSSTSVPAVGQQKATVHSCWFWHRFSQTVCKCMALQAAHLSYY